MRTASKHEVALRVGIGGALRFKPAFGDKLVRIGEDLGIVQGVVKGGNNHTVGWHGVVRGDRKSSGCFVRDLVGKKKYN